MANGQRFDAHKLTAASWYFPFGTEIRVVNVKNGQSVVVTVTDRGPNLRLHRVLDLSAAAAEQLDYLGDGLTSVFLYPLVSFNLEPAPINIRLDEPASREYALEANARENAM
jgi:rare lipoprotein A